MSPVIVFDADLEAVIVFRAQVMNQVLTFALDSIPGFVRDEETGSLWEIRTGKAVEGPLEGTTLTRLSPPLVFWFAWSGIHPTTDVYKP